jgi:large subunit ribosomal protein L17
MRHNLSGRRLGRNTNQRKALMKGLAISIITHERLETTVAKAKELRKFVEPFITLGKNDTVANRRLAMARLGSKSTVSKLFDAAFVARFSSRPGGYCRILRTDHRVGDGADLAIIELVDYVLPEPKEAVEAE